jgi:hypothetical protein
LPINLSVISSLEIADLTDKSAAANLEAKQAVKDAADAKVLAGLIGTTNAQLVASNLQAKIEFEELLSTNLVLQKQIEDAKPENQLITSMSASLVLWVAPNRGTNDVSSLGYWHLYPKIKVSSFGIPVDGIEGLWGALDFAVFNIPFVPFGRNNPRPVHTIYTCIR